MKRIAFLAAVAATVCTVACNKNMEILRSTQNDNEVPQQERYDLKVNVRSGDLVLTKSTTIMAANEEQVNNLQVFVFRGDALDAYASVDNDDELTVSCTAVSARCMPW